MLRKTAEYYEMVVPKISQNVDNFLNTTLSEVFEICPNDTARWHNFQTNFMAYRHEAKNLQGILINPSKESENNTIDTVIRSTNFIIRMGHFIESSQFCFEEKKRLTENDVMGVMHTILRQVIKNIFLGNFV